MKRDDLLQIAKIFNDRLGLSPAISYKYNTQELEFVIRKCATQIIETDIFPLNVMITLVEMEAVSQHLMTLYKRLIKEQLDKANAPEQARIARENLEKAEILRNEAPENTEEGIFVECVDTDHVERKKPRPKSTGGPKQKAPHIVMIGELISEGCYTVEQIAEKVVKEHPQCKYNTIKGYVRDAKNPKYNNFDKPVFVDPASGVYSFVED